MRHRSARTTDRRVPGPPDRPGLAGPAGSACAVKPGEPRAAAAHARTHALHLQMDGAIRLHPLTTEPVTIGRHPRSTIAIDHDTLSRRHCMLEPDPEGWRLRDLDSCNGTFVNGIRITEHPLAHNDVIRVGGVMLRFVKRSDAPSIETHCRDVSPDVRLTRDVLALEVAIRRLVETPADGPLDTSGVRLRPPPSHHNDEDASPARSVLRLVHLLLAAARRIRATDLHLDPKDDHAFVRWRVDGMMLDPIRMGRTVHEQIVRCMRTICRMQESDRSEPEEGHFSAGFSESRVDYRAGFAPTLHGVKLVLRIADAHAAPQDIDALGLHGRMSDHLREIGRRESGLVLACGPTGCGKTTTLHACLRDIDALRRSVVTIEDPVEYQIEHCTQISVDTARGRDFAALLRSVVRQNPDVILVGEIRDPDTATTAMQSAMSGHLVYSTLHARDSIQAIFRLLDLGVERSLIANALDTILAQRLIRTLCPTCRRSVQPSTSEARRMQVDTGTVSTIYVPVGCPHCLHTGFRGRRAVFEMLNITDQIRDDILTQPGIHRIRALAEQSPFTRLVDSGYRLVAQGVTSFDEVARLEAST